MKVYISLNCTREDQIPASTLFLKTIRIGFPDDEILVHATADTHEKCVKIIQDHESKVKIIPAVHCYVWDYIRRLVEYEKEPFWICDTDMVFWDTTKKLLFDVTPFSIIGEPIPQHLDVVTGAIMMGKLHTALMLINPAMVKREISDAMPDYMTSSIRSYIDFYSPTFIYNGGIKYYYDVLSMFFQMSKFSHSFINVNKVFAHLNAGSWLQELKRINPEFGAALEKQHQAIYAGKLQYGQLRLEQQAYYTEQNRAAIKYIEENEC